MPLFCNWLPNSLPSLRYTEPHTDSHSVHEEEKTKRIVALAYAAKLVHTRRALFGTLINFHSETVSGQACNPP